MNGKQQPYEILQYFALAVDPVHVGTGGYRLGRVDLSIVREPGTNVPKIPGTTLSGACRTYAAMVKHRYRWLNNGKIYVCAGLGKADEKKNIEGHCGRSDCPVCVTFGFSRGPGGSFQGLAQFSDARLVFLPVNSLAGPVWVTCPQALADWGVTVTEPSDGEVRVGGGIRVGSRLNLGWLMLDAVPNWQLKPEHFGAGFREALKQPAMQEVLGRAVLVSNKMFGHVVNDNLEVRTSVSIDPSTGAAAEGALYTYEALPRGSVLAFEVVVSDPKFYRIDDQVPVDGRIEDVRETVESGLRLFEALGVGGMNTRGMGRL